MEDEKDSSEATQGNGSAEHHQTSGKAHTEEFKISGDGLLSKIKELIREGNIRRIIIKNEEGKTLIELPVTIGVVGIALAPVLAAVGAVAALVTNCTLVVERRE